jgi:hypothetical protein
MRIIFYSKTPRKRQHKDTNSKPNMSSQAASFGQKAGVK